MPWRTGVSGVRVKEREISLRDYLSYSSPTHAHGVNPKGACRVQVAELMAEFEKLRETGYSDAPADRSALLVEIGMEYEKAGFLYEASFYYRVAASIAQVCLNLYSLMSCLSPYNRSCRMAGATQHTENVLLI